MMHFIDAQDELLCQTERVDGKMCFKWIIFGGSYPGALAGWIAQKYPFAFAATISSSGVVNAMHSLPEFDQQTYRSSGATCAKAQLLAMREIEEAMEHGDEWPRVFMGIEKDELWNLQDFYWFVADAGVQIQQYGNWQDFCPAISEVYSEYGNVTLAYLEHVKADGYAYTDYSREVMRTQYTVAREWMF